MGRGSNAWTTSGSSVRVRRSRPRRSIGLRPPLRSLAGARSGSWSSRTPSTSSETVLVPAEARGHDDHVVPTPRQRPCERERAERASLPRDVVREHDDAHSAHRRSRARRHPDELPGNHASCDAATTGSECERPRAPTVSPRGAYRARGDPGGAQEAEGHRKVDRPPAAGPASRRNGVNSRPRAYRPGRASRAPRRDRARRRRHRRGEGARPHRRAPTRRPCHRASPVRGCGPRASQASRVTRSPEVGAIAIRLSPGRGSQESYFA